MKIRFEFKLQDCWIGLFWKRKPVFDVGREKYVTRTDVWIYLIPCLPIHIIKFGK